RTPGWGAGIASWCPVPTEDSSGPPGPFTSTTRRPATLRLKVRATSSSSCDQAAWEMGASSRCRLFMLGDSLERANIQRAAVLRPGGRSGFGLRPGSSLRIAIREFLEQGGRGNEEQAARDRAAIVEQPVVVARRPADEHVLHHQFDRFGRTRVADEVRAELPLARAANRFVVEEILPLLAFLRDGGERVGRARRFDRVVEF